MADSDLLFKQPSASTGELLFGGDAPATPEDVDLSLVAALPGPTLTVVARIAYSLAVSGSLPPPTLTVQAQYRSNTDRPLTAAVGGSWREGIAVETGVDAVFDQRATHRRTGAEAPWQPSAPLRASADARYREGNRNVRPSTVAPWGPSERRQAAPTTTSWRNGDRSKRLGVEAPWREADGAQRSAEFSWRNGDRSKRLNVDVSWQPSQSLQRLYSDAYRGRGTRLHRCWAVPWRNSIRPPAGTTTQEPPEPPHACYVPSPHLLFKGLYANPNPHLVFSCEHDEPPGPPATVIVPVRSIYVTINNVTLTRVVGNIPLDVLSLRLNIDVDSWTWSFSASLPGAALQYVLPSSGVPVELEASINGHAYRLLAEDVARDRAFGSARVAVSGRGKIARLGSPFAPIQTFSNSTDMTGEQLLVDALTLNGVSIGWTVDWGLEDWLVPAGVWTHQGTHMSAALAIAQAVGGYIQPHPTADTLRVRHRYPVAPWDWAGETPDIELPSAVVVKEGIRSIQKAVYDRVFVAGQRSGILGQVTRTGAAGDLIAPMVTDPLITAIEAARQRGRAILSDTGSQELVTLRLPILTETGVVEPGALVRYLDGTVPRLGLVRSTAIETDSRVVRQILGVETHV